MDGILKAYFQWRRKRRHEVEADDDDEEEEDERKRGEEIRVRNVSTIPSSLKG